MRRTLVLLALCGAPAPVAAGDGIVLTLALGKTVDVEVGNAIGWFCDDPSLVTAQLITIRDVNYWRVSGEKVGTTQCRVGTDLGRASFVFEVTVKRPTVKRKR